MTPPRPSLILFLIYQAVVRVLHQLILFIVPVLEPALRMYLFMLISKVLTRPHLDPLIYTPSHLYPLKNTLTNIPSMYISSQTYPPNIAHIIYTFYHIHLLSHTTSLTQPLNYPLHHTPTTPYTHDAHQGSLSRIYRANITSH